MPYIYIIGNSFWEWLVLQKYKKLIKKINNLKNQENCQAD